MVTYSLRYLRDTIADARPIYNAQSPY